LEKLSSQYGFEKLALAHAWPFCHMKMTCVKNWAGNQFAIETVMLIHMMP